MRNAIAWVEIPTFDFDRAVAFYSNILIDSFRIDDSLGVKLAFFPMEAGGVGGDIVPPTDNYRPSSNGDGPRIYLSCEDKLDQVLSRVAGAGGTILKEKYAVGDLGFVAIIQDTEGNHIGLQGV
jgi:uncharacterized protein